MRWGFQDGMDRVENRLFGGGGYIGQGRTDGETEAAWEVQGTRTGKKASGLPHPLRAIDMAEERAAVNRNIIMVGVVISQRRRLRWLRCPIVTFADCPLHPKKTVYMQCRFNKTNLYVFLLEQEKSL